MITDSYRYIYGPVHSWRLGRSLGVDPISEKKKVCNFDCVYCQLGKTIRFQEKRKSYVPTDRIVKANKAYAAKIAEIARAIHPDEVEINTPLRPSPVNPLPKKDLDRIRKYFKGPAVVSVYDSREESFEAIDAKAVALRY